ncbi:SET domain-containing protein [Durusdinium trenchii]|uniref:SET domain-containing protein n=1 Tax=Durusdinium trenchii TaxID=1381693 RepID=A0ABP0HPP9_9DINO
MSICSRSEGYLRSGWEQPSEEVPNNITSSFGRSGHWRVFAARPFEANELVEVCPLVEAVAFAMGNWYKRNFRTDEVRDTNFATDSQAIVLRFNFARPNSSQGESINFEGFTPYWSKLHGRGVFADTNFKRDEIVELGVDEIVRNEELCFDYGEAYWDAPHRRFQRPKARGS